MVSFLFHLSPDATPDNKCVTARAL
jgi:hypothetical protein